MLMSPQGPQQPSGAVRQRGYGLRLLIFKMANNKHKQKVELGQIRSEEIRLVDS